MYLLDTNIMIFFMKGKNPKLMQRFMGTPRTHKNLCTIVVGELLYGAAKSQWPEASLAKVNALIAHFHVIPFDLDAARHFGDIRAHLAKQATPIGPYDLQIAAIARAHQMILVTHNTREFSRVPGLQIEDWLEEA